MTRPTEPMSEPPAAGSAAADSRAVDSPAGPTPPSGSPTLEAADAEAGLTFEQARDALADVVRRLEEGGIPLEESLALWERGERLAALCERWLQGARDRLGAASPAAGDEPGSGRPQ